MFHLKRPQLSNILCIIICTICVSCELFFLLLLFNSPSNSRMTGYSQQVIQPDDAFHNYPVQNPISVSKTHSNRRVLNGRAKRKMKQKKRKPYKSASKSSSNRKARNRTPRKNRGKDNKNYLGLSVST